MSPAKVYEQPEEVWQQHLQQLVDAHPGHGGKSVVAAEVGVSRQLLNMWLPMRATGKPRQAPSYQNRLKIKAAWERIVRSGPAAE